MHLQTAGLSLDIDDMQVSLQLEAVGLWPSFFGQPPPQSSALAQLPVQRSCFPLWSTETCWLAQSQLRGALVAFAAAGVHGKVQQSRAQRWRDTREATFLTLQNHQCNYWYMASQGALNANLLQGILGVWLHIPVGDQRQQTWHLTWLFGMLFFVCLFVYPLQRRGGRTRPQRCLRLLHWQKKKKKDQTCTQILLICGNRNVIGRFLIYFIGHRGHTDQGR